MYQKNIIFFTCVFLLFGCMDQRKFNNDMPNSENLKLSDKYIELTFVGDEVVNWQTKGVDNYPRGNKLLKRGLRLVGMVIGSGVIFLIVLSISVKSAGGFR